MRRLLLGLAFLLLPALAQAQVTNGGGREVGRTFAVVSSSTITTTSSNVSLGGSTRVLRIVVVAPATNGDRIYISKTAPATTSDVPVDPGQSMPLDIFGGTQVSVLAASGTQAVKIIVSYF